MIKLEKADVFNFEGAIRGARNPMNSHARSDSYTENSVFIFGDNDLGLARRLCAAGTDHRKFMRQIFVSVDITAPLYWWKEYDTYKVATVANSTSTMHKIHSKPITEDDFSADNLTEASRTQFTAFIGYIEQLRLQYLETEDKKLWYDIIKLLPCSYNQTRTCTLNYETLINIYRARVNHKLNEWREFCAWIETLPYAKELIIYSATAKQTEN